MVCRAPNANVMSEQTTKAQFSFRSYDVDPLQTEWSALVLAVVLLLSSIWMYPFWGMSRLFTHGLRFET